MPVRIVDNDFESVDYRDVVDRIDLRDVMAPGKAKHGNKPVLIRCLWHDEQEPSLAVYRTAAFCYGCNKRVSTLEWISLQEGLDIEKEFRQVVDVAHRRYAGGVSVAPRKIEKKELEAWEPMNPAHALFCHERLGKRRQWFRDRGIADWVIDEEKFGYDVKAFTIPIWGAGGELITVRYRRDDSVCTEGPKYWGSSGTNRVCIVNEKALSNEHLQKSRGVVVIAEGELDCFRLWSENVPTVAVTNGAEAFDEGFLPLFDLAEKVVVAFDMDEAGQKASHRVARMFGQRSRIMMWDFEVGKDLTELLQHVDVEFAKSLIAQAKKPGKVNAHWKGKLREGFWKGE